jgi:hypothetical protein
MLRISPGSCRNGDTTALLSVLPNVSIYDPGKGAVILTSKRAGMESYACLEFACSSLQKTLCVI